MTLPSLDFDIYTEEGERGWIGSWFNNGPDNITAIGEPVKVQLVDETNILVSTSAPKGLTEAWTLKLQGKLRPRTADTLFEFGLTVAGRAKLYIDGNLVIDNWTRQRRGESFFAVGSEQEKGTYQLKANTAHDILLEFVNVRGPADGDEDETIMETSAGVRVGGAEVQDPEQSLQQAVKLAKEADVAILVVGLNGDWETEGYDRTTLALPGRTDELIDKVLAVNENTVIVTQAVSRSIKPEIRILLLILN